MTNKDALFNTICELDKLKSINDELVEALEGLFEHCAMIHKHWGDNSNQSEADTAIETALEALEKARTQ